MSTARRASQGYWQLASKQRSYLLVALLCLVPVPTRAYETPLLNHSGSLPALPTTHTADIKDQHPLSHEQLQQRLELMSYIRQQSLVNAAVAADNNVDAIASISMAANATKNFTTEANIRTGGALYFGGVGDALAPGLLSARWHQQPSAAWPAAQEEQQPREAGLDSPQTQTGNATSQASIYAVGNVTVTRLAPRGSSGAKFSAPNPPSVRTPTHRTLRRTRSLTRARIMVRTTATDADIAAAAAATGARRVPAGREEGGSSKPLLSKRVLLSVSDSVGAAQKRGPVPAPAAGAVTPTQHRQQQKQAGIHGVQAVRRANPTAVKVSNSTSTSEQGALRVLPGGARGHKLLSVSNSTLVHNSTFTAVEGVNQQDMARVLPGAGRDGGRKQLLSVNDCNVKPPASHGTAPAVRPSVHQQTGRLRPVRMQPKSVRQQHQRGSWAKCSWWNKIMTLVDAVMRVQGRRKRC